MNTAITYGYRDGDNYKTSETVVVLGELTKSQISDIVGCLDDGEFFIPSQVGLEDIQHKLRGFPDSQSDHVWHGLAADCFEPEVCKNSVQLTANQLHSSFMAAKGHWDVLAASRRLGLRLSV